MKKYGLVMMLIVVSLFLAGCGGGAQSVSNKINVTMTDFHFAPDSFNVQAGKEISFSGRNNGAVTHDFVIMKLGADVGDSFGPEDKANVLWETEIPAGQTADATFAAPTDPGEYQVLCGIPGHYQAGMVAKLTVVAP
jgi:uncharacterized cupredoxin-like copper-binding protein